MGNFNLDDYEPVEERIKRFYKDHDDGRITTDLLSDPNNMGTAVVKAFIYLGEVLVSTGLAYEKNGEGYVNKTSHLENCETSAIGRALANFNYAGSKRPSREEMQKATQEPDNERETLSKEAVKQRIIKMCDVNKHYLDEETITKAKGYANGNHTVAQLEEAYNRLSAKVDEGRKS